MEGTSPGSQPTGGFKKTGNSEQYAFKKVNIEERVIVIYIYIYIYAFSRRFYPKRLTLHSSYSFYIESALAFPGNRTHDLGVANAMLYQLSYRKTFICVKPAASWWRYVHN